MIWETLIISICSSGNTLLEVLLYSQAILSSHFIHLYLVPTMDLELSNLRIKWSTERFTVLKKFYHNVLIKKNMPNILYLRALGEKNFFLLCVYDAKCRELLRKWRPVNFNRYICLDRRGQIIISRWMFLVHTFFCVLKIRHLKKFTQKITSKIKKKILRNN